MISTREPAISTSIRLAAPGARLFRDVLCHRTVFSASRRGGALRALEGLLHACARRAEGFLESASRLLRDRLHVLEGPHHGLAVPLPEPESTVKTVQSFLDDALVVAHRVAQG